MSRLSAYSPTAVSTIFVGLDTESSDIDVICYCRNPERFLETTRSAYGHLDQFKVIRSADPIVVRFRMAEFLFEIYASDTPVEAQMAVRHYQIMARLVDLGGSEFQEAVRELRKQGLKTESAICQLLELEGDPYHILLNVNHWSDDRVREAMATIL